MTVVKRPLNGTMVWTTTAEPTAAELRSEHQRRRAQITAAQKRLEAGMSLSELTAYKRAKYGSKSAGIVVKSVLHGIEVKSASHAGGEFWQIGRRFYSRPGGPRTVGAAPPACERGPRRGAGRA
jgi:hypothetical protein